MTAAATAREPRASVVIPTHNRSRLLTRALDSVLAQTFEDFEVLVVDDGSTDDTVARIEALGDPRVRLLRQEHRGAAAARNRGAREARGEWLVFLDSDDEAKPPWLAGLLEAAEEPSVGIAFCGARLVDDATGEVIREQPPGHLGPQFDHWRGAFYAGTYLLRRELFLAVGGFTEALPANQHTELGLRLVEHCSRHGLQSRRVAAPLVVFHQHAGERIRRDWQAVLTATRYLLEHHGERLARHPPTVAEYLAVAGTAAARLGRGSVARAHYAEAIRTDPRNWRSHLRWLLTLLGPLDPRRWR